MQNYLYDDLYNLEDTHWWHISKRKTVTKLIKKYVNTKKLKILDLGCGTGRNIEELQKFGQTFGVDMSKKALQYCRKRGLKNLRVANCQETHFKNRSFDVITTLDLLEHTDDKKTLKEIHRILNQKGFLIITVPAYQFLWSKWDEVLHHKRRYTKGNLENLVNSSGFQVIKTSYLYSFLIVPAVIIRIVKKMLSHKEYSSDFKLSSSLINELFVFICDLERTLALKFSLPVGTSIICLARKRG